MNKNLRKEFSLGYTVNKNDADLKQLMELVYQSNLIEGISDYWIGTVQEGEELKVPPTITDHIDTLMLVTERNHLNLNNEEVKRVHTSLMQKLDTNAGNYRSHGHSYIQDNGKFIIGNPLPEFVSKLMDSWIVKANDAKTFKEALNLHYEYEVIHPFSDGNGRSGRLLLNWVTLQKFGEYTIIQKQGANRYYQHIQKYREEFIKNNPEIVFTTYNMLPEYEKEKLMKRREAYNKMMYEMFSHDGGKK